MIMLIALYIVVALLVVVAIWQHIQMVAFRNALEDERYARRVIDEAHCRRIVALSSDLSDLEDEVAEHQ